MVLQALRRRPKGSTENSENVLKSVKTTIFVVPPGGLEQEHPKYDVSHTFLLFNWKTDVCTWWKGYWSGFTRNQCILGFQAFVAYVIVLCIISPDAVYNALSYGGKVSPSWGLIYLLMVAIIGGTVGMNTLLEGYILVSLVLAGGIGLLIRYLTYLAAGSDWSNNDVAKGATNTLLLSFTCGVFNILRWKWDLTNVFFFACSIFLIFTQGRYSGEGATTAFLTPVYSLINISLATMVFLLVSWVVFPIYSSKSMRQSTSKAFRSLAKALSAERDLMLGPMDEESGLLQDATGEIDIMTCRDKGLYDKCQSIANHVTEARAALLGNRALRVPSMLEFSVYKRQRPFTLPVIPFMHVDYYSHMLLAIITNLARPLKMGTTNVAKLQGPEIQKSLNDLFASFDASLQSMAQFIAEYDDNPANRNGWKSIDDLMERSHDCWLEFLRAGQKAIKASSNFEENFGVRIVSIFMYEVGSRLRELYVAVAIAVCSVDSSALDLAFARLQNRPAWIFSRTAYEHLDEDPLDIIQAYHKSLPAHRESIHDAKWVEKTKKILKKTQGDRNLSAVLASEFGVTNRSAHMRPRKAFRVPLWFIMGLQYFITVLIASILVVIPAVGTHVFHKRGTDVVFTVVVLWQPNIGSLTSRALNRVLGTGMAAVWSYVLLAITYGATGTTWESSPQKWIVSGFLSSLWGGFCVLNGARYRMYSYMWFVAGFTVSLVTLALLRESTPPWADAGERLLNVIYGIIIAWVVAILVFPISAWRMVRDNYADSCMALHDATTALCGLFEPVNDHGDLAGMKEEILMSPLSELWQSDSGVSAIYTPFERKKLAEAMHLTNKARRIATATSAFIGPAEKETFYFRKPKKIPKGRISKSIYCQNLFMDYIAQILSLKMEFFPQGPWKVTKPFHDALQSSFVGLAKCMALLDYSVHRQGKRIEDVLESLEASCKHVESLAKLAKEMLEVSSTMSPETQDLRAPLQNAEILLVYLCMDMYLQTKAMIYSASQSFMFTDTEAMNTVEEAIQKKDFLSDLRHGPEFIISQLMEKSTKMNTKHASSVSQQIRDHLSSMNTSEM